MKTAFVGLLCMTVLCSATLFAGDKAKVAYVTPTSTVHIPDVEPAGLTKIYSNLGPTTDAYNDAIGFYILGPKSSFGFTQSSALPFTPTADSTVTLVKVPIQWYNDGSSDVARVSIYSDSSGVPGTLLGGPVGFKPPAGFTCCALSAVQFKTGVSVTAGTQYWVVVDTPASSNTDAIWLVVYPTPIAGYNQDSSGWLQNIGYEVEPAGAVYGTVP